MSRRDQQSTYPYRTGAPPRATTEYATRLRWRHTQGHGRRRIDHAPRFSFRPIRHRASLRRTPSACVGTGLAVDVTAACLPVVQTALAGHRAERALATAAHAQTATAGQVVRARCHTARHRRRTRTRTPRSKVVGVGHVGYRCNSSRDVPKVDQPVREHAVRRELADCFDRSVRGAGSARTFAVFAAH